jgi:cysteine sulfinate desulfinase/cysteine desulfurase-like protein
VAAIDDQTRLVAMSLVLFRSACLQDVAPVIEQAHRVGARVCLDVYQAAGAVPMNLGRWRGLRRRRLGEVPLRRPGRGYPVSAPGSDIRAAAVVHRVGESRVSV